MVRTRRARRVAALVAAAGVGAFAPAPPTLAQVSPGPLARPHAHLEGNASCVRCHGAGEGGQDPFCRDCHAGIDRLIRDGRGFHAAHAAESCAGCHPDHAGVDFELIEFPDPESFDHDEAGWPLEGSHRVPECRDCHKVELQVDPVRELLVTEDRAGSWTGLSTACVACHGDYHLDMLSDDCRSCHSVRKWKPAPGFDHDRSDFPLTGKHAGVACAKCHAPVEHPDPRFETTPRFAPVEHASCASCHTDVHRGRLGDDCTTCHRTDGWREIRMPDGSRFDHGRTRFPLVGAHVRVSCDDCHRSGAERIDRPRFDRCDACHADAHAGTATLAGRPADCAACHDERAFRPSTFTVARHADSDYPLAGKHRSVECRSCHAKHPAGVAPASLGTAGVQLRPAAERCADCHADAHGGQLREREDGGRCESCHDVNGWRPSAFDVARHARLEFSLEGAHARTACSACHGPARPGLAPLPVRASALGEAGIEFRVEDACSACHRTPHGVAFLAETRLDGADCARCHTPAGFVPSKVDAAMHEGFAFALHGAHGAVPCIACHEELLGRAPVEETLLLSSADRRPAHPLPLAIEKRACRDCHATPHGGQFLAREDGGACDACHTADRFAPAAAFDHDLDSTFPLSKPHRDVACAECHPTELRHGERLVVYRPIRHECRDCHATLPQDPTTPSSPGGTAQ